MDTSAFLELMQRGTRDEVAHEIRRNPGIVMDTWQRKHGHKWDGQRWAPSGRDIGWDAMPWVWAFRVAGYTRDLQPAHPPSGILLYRGATHERRHGMGWSSHYDYAAAYAVEDGSGRKYNGNIYQHNASGRELLASVHRATRDEWVVDPRYLHDGNVVLANYSEWSTRRVLTALRD